MTFTGSVASTIPWKTNATYNLGASTLAPLSIYLGNGTKSTRIMAGTVGTSWTFTLPNDVPTITGKTMVFNTSGTAEFRYPDKFTSSQTTTYVATGDETVILCDTSSAAFTVTLPAASTCAGKELTIVKTNSALDKPLTIDGYSTEIIIPSVVSGQQTYLLYTINENVTLKCNGTSWYVVSSYTSTSWASYTPSTYTGIGTPSSVSLFYRRVGDTCFVRGRIVAGTTSAAFASMALPGDLAWDSAKVTGGLTDSLGFWYSNINTTATGTPVNTRGPFPISVYSVTTTTGIVFCQDVDLDGTVAGAYFKAENANVFSQPIDSDPMIIQFSVPISGWNP